jgi:hypothetical protein
MGAPQDLNWISSRITIYLPDYYALLLSSQALLCNGMQVDGAGEVQVLAILDVNVTCYVLPCSVAAWKEQTL